MRDRYRLQSLRDVELIRLLPLLAQRDNEHTADMLAHLAELDDRKLYLDLGFRSIWEYCTVGLGFCETTAWRRYTAARVCRRFPAAFEQVARGELHISALAALAKHLTVENASELFEGCHRQSIRRVEQLLAARFPVADFRESIRRLPAVNGHDERLGPPAGSDAVVSGLGVRDAPASSEAVATSGAGCELTVKPQLNGCGVEQRSASEFVTPAEAAPVSPASAPAARASVEALSADRFGVRFTVDAEFLELLEQVRDLAGHRDGNGDLLRTMKAAIAAYRSRLLKVRFAVGQRSRPQPTTTQAAATPATRAPARETAQRSTTRRKATPAVVSRAVYERDGGQCTYVAPDGRRCSGRRSLELDHIEPHAAGGLETFDNLRLRCRAHNQRYARQYFSGAIWARS